MSFSTTETATIDIILKRNHYYIWRSVRWGDLCDIKNEGDGILLFVHRPFGLKAVAYGLALLGMALIIGFSLSFGMKAALIALLIVIVVIAIRFLPKPDISFYTDSEYKKRVFRVVSKNGDQLLSRMCQVFGAQNDLLGTLKNEFSWSPKAVWRVYRPTQEAWVRADQKLSWNEIIRAIIARYKGDAMAKYRVYRIFKKDSTSPAGEIDLHGASGDHLNLQADPDLTLDRRVALALSVVVRSL